MRLAALAITGALGLAATAMSAQAAPLAVPQGNHGNPGVIQVWGGCGPGARPVPGHWRGPYWVPPHCAPAYRAWAPAPHYRRYWHRHYYW